MKALRSVKLALVQERAHVLGVGRDGVHVVEDCPALGEHRLGLLRLYLLLQKLALTESGAC